MFFNGSGKIGRSPIPNLQQSIFSPRVLLWIVSFPLVIALGQLVDMLLTLFGGFQGYEQVAVRYLKTTLESPLPLTLALFTILIAAPIIEEFLFRGLLQSYLKRI